MAGVSSIGAESSTPLGGFLTGFQQGQGQQMAQAKMVADQIMQQHQDEWQSQQADLLGQKQQAAQDQFTRKQDETERANKAKEQGKTDALAGASQRASMRFDQRALDRVAHETDYYVGLGQGQDEAHARAVANETARQHGVPSHQIPGSLPFDMSGEATVANGQSAQSPDGGAAGVLPGQTGDQTGVAAVQAVPGVAPTQSAPGADVQTLLNLSGGIAGGAAGIGQTAQSPDAAQGTAAAPGAAQTPGTAPGMAPGGGALPLVAARIQGAQARAGQAAAQADLIKQRTLTEQVMRDPRLANLQSLMTDRDAQTAEKTRHDGVVEKLGQSAQTLRDRLGSRGLDLAQQRVGIAQQNANTASSRAQAAAQAKAGGGAGDARLTGQILSLRGQANAQWKDAKNERDKMIGERDHLASVMAVRPTLEMYGGDQVKYQAAVAKVGQAQQIAKARLLTLVGPDGKGGRIGELDSQLMNLNDQLGKADAYLQQHVTPLKSDGSPDKKGAGFNSGISAPGARGGRTNFTSVDQVGTTPNVNFIHNAAGDRGQVNPNLLATVQQTAQNLGYKVQVGTAISGHSPNVVIHGRDTGRASQHGSGNAFDIVSIAGPDGRWHGANVNDAQGRQMAYQLGQALAAQGHQAIFGVDNGAVGNHMDHLHVGYSAKGNATSYLATPWNQAAPAAPTVQAAHTPTPAAAGRPAQIAQGGPAAKPAARTGNMLHYDPKTNSFH